MDRSQPQTWSSGRAQTFHETQQRQQFFTATASVIQLPPVSPMEHQYPRLLHQSLQRESEQNMAFPAGFAPAALRVNDSLNYNESAARGAAPFLASGHGSSNEFVQRMSNSTSSHQTAPAEQAWDIASSNANRLMAKLSRLKNTIRTVRERTGEAEPPMFPEMHPLSPFPVHMWDSADATGDGAQYSQPYPPPASPPIPNEEGPAYMSHQQSNVVLPSPPAFFSPKSQLPSNSTLLNQVQHLPHSPALVTPLLQKPHQLPAVENLRGGACAMQLAPDSQEVDANLRSYINSLEERVTALTFENNKLKSSNESMHMTIKSMSDAALGEHVNDPALWQQQQNLKAALEQRVSSLQRQSELVQVFDATCVNQSELIGDGSFGQVRMGVLTLPVAVKTARRLGQGVASGSDAARETSLKQEEQLFREASLQGALRHPGVVSALGISILEGGQVALITELVKGRSLEDILHSKKISLSIQETVTIAIQLADALAYLHHRSVVHRDVKPGNILVSSDMIVKLCDFGLACRLQGRSSDHVPRAGTPVYLAPETLSNKSGSVNEPVDVYSFAIVCWEMCTGQQIWSELLYGEMEKQVLSGNRPPIPPHVPSAFANMIRACWDQNPAHRPNFRAILHMLRKMGGELPPQASHGVYFSRDVFRRFLHGEGSYLGTPRPPIPMNSNVLLDVPSPSVMRHMTPTPSATATSSRVAAAGLVGSPPATPRRWDGVSGARQGDTIVI